MISNLSFVKSLLVLILLLSSLISTNIFSSTAWAQSENVETVKVTDLAPIEIGTLKVFDQCLQEWPILQDLVKKQAERIVKLEDSLAAEKRTNELNERELALQKKIDEIKDKEIASLTNANDRLKDISDRAIKLAEVSKPPAFGNWQLFGIAGGAALIILHILSK